MTIDWDFILNAKSNNLTDDQVEVLFDQLIEYNVDGSENIEQLQKLFLCSKFVMQIKAIQADVAIEELEKIVSRKEIDKNFSSLDENYDFEANKSIIFENENRNEHLMELERNNELLRTQLNEKEIEISRLEQNNLNLEQTIKLNEKQLLNYNLEINQLRNELVVEKEQINEHLNENELPYEQLREINKKFQILLQEMNDMEKINNQLGKKVKDLNKELNLATLQIQTATKEIEYLKKSLNNLQEMNDILIYEKENYLIENDQMKEILKAKQLELDKNLEKTKNQIIQLTDELNRKEDQLNKLKNSVDSNQQDSFLNEKNKAYFLAEVSKRDNHIKLLKNQLNQATADIEAQTGIIENLIEKNLENQKSKEKYLNINNLDDDSKLGEFVKKITYLEEELQIKDQELNKLLTKTNLYEKGIYGLSEALEEINQLKYNLELKDQQIDDLVKELNLLNIKFTNTQDELDYLKEISNTDEKIKEKFFNESDGKINDKLRILKLQKEIIKLDAEKINLHEELTNYKLNINNRNLDVNNVFDHKNLLHSKFENQIKQLENENKELHLAMKEILICLKESDSKSDFVIECPSLERLCQFYESRSINCELTSVISLKAELDLIRGHNEELRMANKRLRNDTFKIFENYSKFLLGETNLNNYNSKQLILDKSDKNIQNESEDEVYLNLSEGEIILSELYAINDRNNSSIKLEEDIFEENEIIKECHDHENKIEIKSDLHNIESQELNYNILKDENEIQANEIINDNKQLDFKNNDQTIGLKDLNYEKDINENFDLKKIKENKVEQIILDVTTNKNQTQLNLIQAEKNTMTDFLEEHNLYQINKKLNLKETFVQTENLSNSKTNVELKFVENLENQNNFELLKEMCDNSTQTYLTLLKDLSDEKLNKMKNQDQIGKIENLNLNETFSSKKNSIHQVSNKEECENKFDEAVLKEFETKINYFQNENLRLKDELKTIVQVKDDLINENKKNLSDLNEKLLLHKEQIILLEKKIEDLEKENKLLNKLSEKPSENDKQLVVLNKHYSENENNQTGCINILETIIKCLQTRIQHKDEAITHYQQLLSKTHDEHQNEMQKVINSYKKASEESIKNMQSKQSSHNEKLESSLIKCNNQLNQLKVFHQKMLAEFKKANELQNCKLKRLQNENDLLKSKNSLNEINKLNEKNLKLSLLLEQNEKIIEKLKFIIKKERLIRITENQKNLDSNQTNLINENLPEEVSNLKNLIEIKNNQIKELEYIKWNLEKKITELNEDYKSKLKLKTDEINKLHDVEIKLKKIIEKIEKEKFILRKSIQEKLETKDCANKLFKNNSTQTNVGLDDELGVNKNLIEKCKKLDDTISLLKNQLKLCSNREKELIQILDQKQNSLKKSLISRKNSTDF